MSKPILLVIASNPLHNGPRMIREMQGLKSHFDIYAMGSTPPLDKSIKYININIIYGLERAFKKAYKLLRGKDFLKNLLVTRIGLHMAIRRIKPDCIINHNPIFLPILFNYKERKFKIVFNAHEYHPLEFEGRKGWLETTGEYYKALYQKYLPKLDLLINVSDGIAKRCLDEFSKSSLVIPNAANYRSDLHCSPTGSKIRIIHHGIANEDRKIEVMIEALRLLGPAYEMDLMLMPSASAYAQKLQKLCDEVENVRIIPIVNFVEIVSTINTYDIGLYTLPTSSFNNEYALPNKFFEFIQARLCIVVGPSPEMAKIVREHKLGYVTEGFSAQAIFDTISTKTAAEIDSCKLNSGKASRSLSAETYYAGLDKAMLALLNS